MKTLLLPMVGRTRFELVTNGLKGRCAPHAQAPFPLCIARTDGLKRHFSPALCQKLPTSKQARRYNGATPQAVRLEASLPTPSSERTSGMSKSNFTLTAERLRELFSYDPESGLLVRLSTGMPAQARNQGYLVASVDGSLYKVHRLAWLYVHGAFPDGDVDHINRDRADNRMVNLRQTTRALNHQNSTSTRSASGVRGVSRMGSRWRAAIAVDGVDHYLGTFATIPEAAAARALAEARLHPLSPLAAAL